MRIVVLGGGFGGLRAATWLRKKLPARDHEVVLIANKDHFIFKPSLIWVPFYDREVEEITLPLGPLLKRAGVHYIQHHVAQVDPNLNHIVLQNGAILSFDYLLIATGGLPNWGTIPGLRGNTCSIYEVDDTLKTCEKVNVIQDGDSIVIGVAQQNPLPSIAYEFLFELEDNLQEKGIQAPISFFTYEQNGLELAGMNVSTKWRGYWRRNLFPFIGVYI